MANRPMHYVPVKKRDESLPIGSVGAGERFARGLIRGWIKTLRRRDLSLMEIHKSKAKRFGLRSAAYVLVRSTLTGRIEKMEAVKVRSAQAAATTATNDDVAHAKRIAAINHIFGLWSGQADKPKDGQQYQDEVRSEW